MHSLYAPYFGLFLVALLIANLVHCILRRGGFFYNLPPGPSRKIYRTLILLSLFAWAISTNYSPEFESWILLSYSTFLVVFQTIYAAYRREKYHHHLQNRNSTCHTASP